VNAGARQTDARVSHGKPWSPSPEQATGLELLRSGLPRRIWKLERAVNRLAVALFLVPTVALLIVIGVAFAISITSTDSPADAIQSAGGLDDMSKPNK
jgi:hypothetical protein